MAEGEFPEIFAQARARRPLLAKPCNTDKWRFVHVLDNTLPKKWWQVGVTAPKNSPQSPLNVAFFRCLIFPIFVGPTYPGGWEISRAFLHYAAKGTTWGRRWPAQNWRPHEMPQRWTDSKHAECQCEWKSWQLHSQSDIGTGMTRMELRTKSTTNVHYQIPIYLKTWQRTPVEAEVHCPGEWFNVWNPCSVCTTITTATWQIQHTTDKQFTSSSSSTICSHPVFQKIMWHLLLAQEWLMNCYNNCISNSSTLTSRNRQSQQHRVNTIVK